MMYNQNKSLIAFLSLEDSDTIYIGGIEDNNRIPWDQFKKESIIDMDKELREEWAIKLMKFANELVKGE